MISCAKNYIYKNGVLIFDIKDYGTSVFLKLTDDLLYLRSISLKYDALDVCDAYAIAFAREHELGELRGSYLNLKLSYMSHAFFTFTSAPDSVGVCNVNYSIDSRVTHNRVVFCDINNLSWMVLTANTLVKMDSAEKQANFQSLIKGTEYEKIVCNPA